MRTTARIVVALLLVVALPLFAGTTSSSASTATTCNGTLCVTVVDVDGVSPSFRASGPNQPDVLAYQFYRVTVTNAGSVPLSAGTLSIALTDLRSDATVVSSTAEFNAASSPPACARVSQLPNRVTCSIPALPAGGTSSPLTIVYRTSRTPGVTATNAALSLALGAATITAAEQTSLESDPEGSDAWSPPGLPVQLATSPSFDTQFSTLQYRVPSTSAGFAASLDESHGIVCAPGLTCFGELITTDLSGAVGGTFSPTNLFHLTFTYSGVLPRLAASQIVVSHRRDDGTFEVIRRRCQTIPPAATAELPCISVVKDEVAGRLVVDVWGFQNGGWMAGG